MKNKARLVAVSGFCSAVCALCLLLASVPAVRWGVLLIATVASVVVTVPMMLDDGGVAYSLLAYVASSVVGFAFGLANVVAVAPLVTFCMPFAIVKVFGESVRFTATFGEKQTLADPYDDGDDKQIVPVTVHGKRRLSKVVKWILYYILLQVGIALTLGATYLFTPAVFDALVASDYFVWLLIVAQAVPFLYDLLLRGCLRFTAKALLKALK